MRRRAGFTLIEVLAVVALTSVVLGVALDFYLDLSNASTHATEFTRDVRRATALMDRVAHDFETAVLVTKPPEVDPLSHPWLFLAESHVAGEGSDHIKFVTRNHRPRSGDVHESDLAVVAYSVRRGDDDLLELRRWSSPGLPESLDRHIPDEEAEGAQLMADDLEAFGVRFMDPEGEWLDDWDSTTLAASSELPRMVEIQVAMADADGDPDSSEPTLYSRRVLIPMRPVDLEVLLDPALAAQRSGTGQDKTTDDEKKDDGNTDDVADEEDSVNDCSDPSSPIQQKTVAQCKAAVAGRFVRGVRNAMERLGMKDDDPFCRWENTIIALGAEIFIHKTCR